MNFRLLVLAALTALLMSLAACGSSGGSGDSSSGEDRPFPELEEAARGTKVNLSMYGGDDAINAYVDDYVIPELKKKHDIELTRTPLNDTADAVNKLLNEKQAGKDEGTIDLVWLNGENFATGADASLWYGPWAEELPNAKYIDWESPSINRDFGYPVEGREAPWGKAQFVMIHDSEKVKDPPKTMDELREWTEDNPGRFTYPAPPDFTGNAFTEQVFYGVTGGPKPYQKPFDEKVFEEKSPEFSEFLNDIEPNLWREGETYPETSTKLDELYQNGEVWLTMSYNPLLAQRQISKGLFSKSTRTYLFEDGTLNNTHYLAIPSNGPNKAGAQVVANFLESPEAQVEKQDPDGWGDLTALSVDRLPEDARKKLSEPEGTATLSTQELEKNRVPEARSEWLLAIEDAWKEKVLKD
ncbi:MAG: ABC transporter substrate-binding protein [Rubrobacter sp.]|nr:ABC transporter substrate-binding protein [Rubrobacter sp.]MDQ3302472.1 ABC transporter substrate-binding protein [Actinomycetota bacterium]